MPTRFRLAFAMAALGIIAADAPIPHAQDRPPNEPYPAQEAARRMTVPEGFSVEVVASEPEIINPIAMTIDDRGRFWVAESLEYPRHEAGTGRDRIKVLEDANGDGKAETVSVFAENLNIPSGLAVGHGGVWVADAPDILFLQDTDGDGKADKKEVVVTGFGRADTHELPNSLTWGPDGWLYGWNGIFNPSVIRHRGKEFRFTCAVFRIHPRTRDFEVFCEGTSNPWGITWNEEGEAFASACVIDHLWHLTETGQYQRQAGPYPPYSWPLGSIAGHGHQKAAYCGIHYFDSEAYPERYRGRLFLGNVHGSRINIDAIARKGATYRSKSENDFLVANDAWFVPVATRTGPDGSLYVLDWYDRYHCYQDAQRDPGGIDRRLGRLYRVRYKDTPRAPTFDLSREFDSRLVDRLRDPNVYYRETARRILSERAVHSTVTREKLESIVRNKYLPRSPRLNALWALIGAGPLSPELHRRILIHDDPAVRAWAVRAAGDQRKVERSIRDEVIQMVNDPAREVLLQVVIATPKLDGVDPIPVLVEALSRCGDDPILPQIAWQNLHPLLEDRASEFLGLVEASDSNATLNPNLARVLPRAFERLLGRRDPAPAAAILARLASGRHADTGAARRCLEVLASQVQSGAISGARLDALREAIRPTLAKLLDGPADGPLRDDAALVAASWKDKSGLDAVRRTLDKPGPPDARRLRAIDALIASGDASALDSLGPVLADEKIPDDFRDRVLASLGRLDDPKVADVVLTAYPRLGPVVQPRAIALLTQRDPWSRSLVRAVARKEIPADAVHLDQIRKLQGSKDPELVKDVRATWGTVREGRNPDREAVVSRMRTLLRNRKGNPHAGPEVFKKLCAQCHKIYGEGQEVGPDLTGVGRSSFEGLLSNVFDPNLVIGSSYQATTVATKDGRVLTGLLSEDGPQQIVLKVAGGKSEILPRDDVAEVKVSPISLMPEDLEKQLSESEWADLFAFLTLDKPPGDPAARPIPGSAEVEPRETDDPARFAEILGSFAPGFSTRAVGERGLAIEKEHLGRKGVLRTHPVGPKEPCVLRSTVDVPAGKKSALVLDVSHDEKGDWQLVVLADGKTLHDSVVGPKTTQDGWSEIRVDLTPFAGRKVEIELRNAANGWAWEFGYWGRIAIVSE